MWLIYNYLTYKQPAHCKINKDVTYKILALAFGCLWEELPLKFSKSEMWLVKIKGGRLALSWCPSKSQSFYERSDNSFGGDGGVFLQKQVAVSQGGGCKCERGKAHSECHTTNLHAHGWNIVLGSWGKVCSVTITLSVGVCLSLFDFDFSFFTLKCSNP